LATRLASGSADVGGVASLAPVTHLSRWPYRVAQFLRGFRTAVDPGEARSIAALLSEAELQLFLAMRPRDRRHAVETMRHARRIAEEHAATPTDDLLVAALMHDVGKGRLRVEDRVLYVILRAISLDLVDRFAASEGARWRRAMWHLRHHAAVGAAQLQAIGSSSRVVQLTAVHHDAAPPAEDLELAWLLDADEAA
jgi:hypothetical protein